MNIEKYLIRYIENKIKILINGWEIVTYFNMHIQFIYSNKNNIKTDRLYLECFHGIEVVSENEEILIRKGIDKNEINEIINQASITWRLLSLSDHGIKQLFESFTLDQRNTSSGVIMEKMINQNEDIFYLLYSNLSNLAKLRTIIEESKT